MSCRYYLFPRQIIYLFFLLWAYCNVIDSCCREIIRLRGKYGTTSEAITKSAIIAIILLILRSFLLKTEDIHPPKTGISVHFYSSLL